MKYIVQMSQECRNVTLASRDTSDTIIKPPTPQPSEQRLDNLGSEDNSKSANNQTQSSKTHISIHDKNIGLNIYIYRREHTGDDLECGNCPKPFLNPRELKDHVNIHTKETTYLCLNCGERFQTNKKMLYHRE